MNEKKRKRLKKHNQVLESSPMSSYIEQTFDHEGSCVVNETMLGPILLLNKEEASQRR